MTEKNEMHFKVKYCGECEHEYVECPKCGNCCNDTYGTLKNGETCDICPLAYQYQNLYNRYKDYISDVNKYFSPPQKRNKK